MGGAQVPNDQVERVLSVFRERYRAGAPFREDRERVDELAAEAVPAVEDLAFAAREGGGDLHSMEHHEGLAMITLLGRRAAGLGITPTAALSLVPAVLEGLAAVGHQFSSDAAAHLQALSMEGYVAGRDDRTAEDAARRASEALGIVRVAPRCLVLVLAGRHEPEFLGEAVERFGRALLEADAISCVVDLARLEAPEPDRAAEVFGAHATARMIGVTCIFTGASPAWLEAARATRMDVSLLALEPSFEHALNRALSMCGLGIRPASRFGALLRSLRRPRS